MSWDVVKQVINRGPRLGLDHFEFRVLLYLADRQNAKTGQLNPSPERLAIDCGLPEKTSERAIRRVIRRLEAKGLVERIGSSKGGQAPGGRYPTQHYRLRGDFRSPLGPDSAHLPESPNRGDSQPPLESDRGGSQSEQGGLTVRNRGDSQSPEPRKLEPRKKNLSVSSRNGSGSQKRNPSASIHNNSEEGLCKQCGGWWPDAHKAACPNWSPVASSGRISDALLARVLELDPDAVREIRHDGSEYVELSDGTELPNSKRAEMWTRYEGQYR